MKKITYNIFVALLMFLARDARGETRGPQASITCPAGAINLAVGDDIPVKVNNNPPGTSFCVKAGTHKPTAPINLKANTKFVGEYGAIIDGASVTQGWDVGSISIIRAWNCPSDCGGVLVQNLVVRNLRGYNCIGVYSQATAPNTNNWIIDHNEVSGCKVGVNFGYSTGAQITNNFIHHNTGNPDDAVPSYRGGGYGGYNLTDVVYANNDISYNGPEQKCMSCTKGTWRDNFVHHNFEGIWFDGDATGTLIETNLVEDNSGSGIFYEVSGQGVIRNNIVRRSAHHGIFISTSKDVEVYGNRLEDNARGIQYFVNCGARGQGKIAFDLANVNAHDNIIKIPPGSDILGSTFSYLSDCSAADVVPYTNGTKNLRFQANRYYAPTLSGWNWYWAGTSPLQWGAWQALGHDTAGTVQPLTAYGVDAAPNPPRNARVAP